MKLQGSCVLMLGLLLGAGLTGCADRPGQVAEKDTASESTAGRSMAKDARPAKPDPAVIAAWEKAGAEFGWMGVNESGFLTWRHSKPAADRIPAFSFPWASQLRGTSLRGLPQPDVPFAMSCRNVTDTVLKELARLKQLQCLDLSRNRGVTDAGLKELAGLTQLLWLSLNDTQGRRNRTTCGRWT